MGWRTSTVSPSFRKEPMRVLTGHIVNPANDKLTVTVEDTPGQGGACHRYAIDGFDATGNPANFDRVDGETGPQRLTVMFQNGPINEFGVNGITHEVLLSILIDRLECFQAGLFACASNQTALDHLRGAQEALLSRTRERMARNVEGTHQK